MIQTEIHPTAIVSNDADIGVKVTIGPYSIVHAGVCVGDRSNIGSHCEIGLPTPLAKGLNLEIGDNANIRSHSVLYQGSKIGSGLTTGHYITIREKAFIGDGFQLGSRGDVQGDCVIGDYVRTHADVHIGQKSQLGNYIWLFPNVLLTNDPDPPSEQLTGIRIHDYVVVAANALLLPGVDIGKNSVIAAASTVKNDVPEGMLASGNPAKIVCKADILRMHNDPSKKSYPWTLRFHRGYPQEVVKEWLSRIPTSS